MENEEIEVYYKFYDKDLNGDIVNTTDNDIKNFIIQLIKAGTDIVIAERVAAIIKANDKFEFKFNDVPTILMDNHFRSYDSVQVKCISPEGKIYDNFKIRYWDTSSH